MDDLVILVEQGEPGREIGNEHEVLVDVDVGGKNERFGESFEVLAVQVEPLKPAVCAVGHTEGRGFRIPAVDPESVREVEFSVAFSGLADGGEISSGGIIPVNAVGTVTIREINTPVRGMEGGIGGHEFVPAPITFGGGILAFGIAPRGHGGALIPNDVSLEGEFGKGLHVLISGDVEEFLFSLGPDFDAVPAALELAAEGADELAGWVEDEDAGVILDVGIPLVHDVEVLSGIHGDIVGGLPVELVGKLGEVVIDFVFVFAFADNYRTAGFLGGNDVGEREGGSSEERGFTKEFATG